MSRKYEEIPLQFMPKHSHKYLMRKTLVNTKFQWLMKYINQQNQEPQERKLSNGITIAPKDTLYRHKERIVRSKKSNHHFTESQSNGHQNSTILQRNTKQRTSTEPGEEELFMEKKKLKKSLLLSRSKSKKFPLLFDRDCHQTISRKPKGTEGIGRSKTSDCRKPLREKENYNLTPWILPDDNHQTNDLVSYF